MQPNLTQYLESIRFNARLEHADESGVMSELEAHIEDKLQELTDAGLSEEAALKKCLDEMGNTQCIARQIYEAYSQGSWREVLLAAMPHFLCGLLFFLDWWQYPAWIILSLGLIIAITFYGWSHGKPAWIFSWLGYSMLPVIAVGLVLFSLPGGWTFLALPIYFPLAIWWLVHVVIMTAKRDWLFSSLMLLPVPIILGWFLAISPSGKFTDDSLKRVADFAPWIGMSFMGLALTIAIFIRLRQRGLRVGLLAASGLATLFLIVYYANGRLNNLAFLGPMMVEWGTLFFPPLLERRLKRGRIKAAAPENP
ncbi:MAG: permease prefix domain 1-containing protein [Dehalococcoidales bacterium]|jgi:hypothetical protein